MDQKTSSQTNKSELNRDQVIDQVIVIWQYTLQNDYAMKKDVNFFDAGGDSLHAVEIVSDLNDIFGVELSVSSFVNAPTPEEQADLLLSEDWDRQWEAAVALKSSGNKPPFFCVHPSDGNVLCYTDLASAMSRDYPFYGLQAKGLKGDVEPHRDIIEMASYYIDAIKKIQHHGPYYIGGWSAGGVIAFEISQQLIHAGEKVQLMLIDTYFPILKAEQSNTDKTIDSYEQSKEMLFDGKQSSLPEKYKQASTLRSIWAESSTRYGIKKYQGDITLLLSESYDTPKKTFIAQLKQQIAANNLVNCRILIQKLEQWEEYNPLNWQRATDSRFETYSIPGNHHSILYEENCPQLAQRIMQFIDSAETHNH